MLMRVLHLGLCIAAAGLLLLLAATLFGYADLHAGKIAIALALAAGAEEWARRRL